MATWSELNKQTPTKAKTMPSSSGWSSLNSQAKISNSGTQTSAIDMSIARESETSPIDKSLFSNLRKQGRTTEQIKQMEPTKVTKTDVLKDLFRATTESAKKSFEPLTRTTGSLIQFAQTTPRVISSLAKGGETPFQAAKSSVGKAVNISTGKEKPDVVDNAFRTVRGVSTIASSPFSAVLGALDKQTTAKQTIAESFRMADDVMTNKDVPINQGVADGAQMYLKSRGVGKYGGKEANVGDVAVLSALGMFDLLGDVLLGAGEMKAGAAATKEFATWKQVQRAVKELPEDVRFLRGTMREVEIPIDANSKIRIKPKEKEIVLEGYKKRFGKLDDIPTGKQSPETKALVESLDNMTGKSGVELRYDGDNLIIKPKGIIDSIPTVRPPVVQGVSRSLFSSPQVSQTMPQATTETLYRGSKGNVEEVKKTYSNVLDVGTNQKEVLETLASQGNASAKMVLDDPKDFYVRADEVIQEAYKDTYDAIKYNNSQLPQKGVEYHDLKEDRFYAPEKATAEAYALQNRKGKYDTQAVDTQEKIVQIETSAPVKSEGKLRDSRLFKRVQETLDGELEGTVQYNQMNIANDTARAVDLVENNFDDALDIVRGRKETPKDQTYNNIGLTITEKALDSGDFSLAGEAITRTSLNATRAGQEIVVLRGKAATSPTNVMRQVVNNKIVAKGGKEKVMKQIDDMSTSEFNKIVKRVEKIQSAQDIIDSLIC